MSTRDKPKTLNTPRPQAAPNRNNRTTPHTCGAGALLGMPSPEHDGKSDYVREYEIMPWYFDTGD